MTVSVFQIGSTDVWDEGDECGEDDDFATWLKRKSSNNWSNPGVVGSNYTDGVPIATSRP